MAVTTAPAGSTIPGQNSWVNSGLSFLNTTSASLSDAMNSIGGLFANSLNFGSQIKAIANDKTDTYSPVGATATATATSGAVNPMIGGIPVLPFALGGLALVAVVMLMRK